LIIRKNKVKTATVYDRTTPVTCPESLRYIVAMDGSQAGER